MTNTPSSPEEKEIIVYTREGCQLCEEMAVALFFVQKEIPFQIHLVDIDDNPLLLKKYNADVPVVMLHNTVLFRHFFDEDILRRALVDE